MHNRLAAIVALAAGFCASASQGDPFHAPAQARVFLFIRTDCPLTAKYAPELRRIAQEFEHRNVDFWLVYPDRTETESNIRAQIMDYGLPGKRLLDPAHDLVRRAQATVAPEAAVFDGKGTLVYRGRIDNRWVDFGKARPTATVHDLEDAIHAVLDGKPVAQPQTRAVGCSLADVE